MGGGGGGCEFGFRGLKSSSVGKLMLAYVESSQIGKMGGGESRAEGFMVLLVMLQRHTYYSGMSLLNESAIILQKLIVNA